MRGTSLYKGHRIWDKNKYVDTLLFDVFILVL